MTKPYNYDQTVIDNFFNITVRPPDKSAYQKIILLFLNQNICCCVVTINLISTVENCMKK